MVGIHIHKNAAKASAYYTAHLASKNCTQGYYSEDNKAIGEWFGKGAEMLGLSGEASKAAFDRLCRNLHPSEKKTLNMRRNRNARAAYDFCISADKTISLLALLLKDKRIVDAHVAAAHETLGLAQGMALVRVRKGDGTAMPGKMDIDRSSKNIAAVLFHHTTSRNSDPQLHTHALVFNTSFDHFEKRWKALQAVEMVRQSALLTAVYRNRLCAILNKTGYETHVTAKGELRIAGVPKAIVDVFSKRKRQIDAIEKALGHQGNAVLRAQIAHKSRAAKDSTKTAEELRELWLAQLTPNQIAELEAVKARAIQPVTPARPFTVKEAMELAASHLFERRSVVKTTALFREALRIACGQHDLRAFQMAFETMGAQFIVKGDALTTQAAVDAERALLAFVEETTGKCSPLNPHFASFAKATGEQRKAITTILSSTSQVMALDGPAGTGKTVTLTDLTCGLREKGHDFILCAPTASAVDILRNDGFEDAITLQRLLTDRQRQKSLHGSVIIMDEAGLASVAQLNELFAIAKKQRCRILLVGDARQHKSIESGDGLRLLEAHSTLERAQIYKIYRQKHKGYESAINDLKDGKHSDGFKKLDALGWVQELDDSVRYQKVAKDYVSSVSLKKSCLVVCATWDESRKVTEDIRKQLRCKRLISQHEVSREVLEPLHLTLAQRQQCSSYDAGQIIVFQRKSDHCVRGERLEVVDATASFLKVRTRDGRILMLDPEKDGKRLAVFAKNEIPLSSGDKLLIRANGEAASGERLVNGEIVTVESVSIKGDIVLDDGREICSEWGHVGAGYAVSSQCSQGKTVDMVFLPISAISAQSAASQETLYVAASRARERCTIYTDAKDLLFEAFKRSGERQAAIEFIRDQNYENKAVNPDPGSSIQPLSGARVAPTPQTVGEPDCRQAARCRTDTTVRAQRLHSDNRNQGSPIQDEQPVRTLPGAGSRLPAVAIHHSPHRGF